MFQLENVFVDIDLSTQEEVFTFLADHAYSHGTITNKEEFIQVLWNREKETTTGFGNHIAIPHARSNCVKNVDVMLCRLDKDIEWNALDGKGVSLIIALMTPEDAGEIHLRMLSKLARLLMHDDFTNRLKKGTKNEIYNMIQAVIQ